VSRPATWTFRRAVIEDVPLLLSTGWERATPAWFLAQGGQVVWTWLRRAETAEMQPHG
jgi:hypothetical protein